MEKFNNRAADEEIEDAKNVTCCLCIPIRIGVWILAVLATASALWKIGVNVMNLCIVYSLEDDDRGDVNKTTDEDEADLLLVKRIAIAQLWVKVSFGLVHLAFSIVLMYGLRTRNPKLLKTWVIYSFCLLGLDIIKVIFVFILVAAYVKNPGVTAVGLTVMLGFGLFLLLEFYYTWVVRTYSRILERENTKKMYMPVANSNAKV